MTKPFYKAKKAKWFKVSERLPRQRQRVIARYDGVYGPRIVSFWSDGVNTHFGDLKTLESHPATHWKPISFPPL